MATKNFLRLDNTLKKSFRFFRMNIIVQLGENQKDI